MKTLKSMSAVMAALLLLFASAYSFAKPHQIKLTKDDVVNMYVSAVTQGKINSLPGVLDDDFTFNMQRGESVNSLNKNQFLDYLKGNSSPDSAVTPIVTTMEDSDEATKVKIDFKYADYVRTDVVTISNAGGWRITNVTSSYK
jgi:hypothetical protein